MGRSPGRDLEQDVLGAEDQGGDPAACRGAKTSFLREEPGGELRGLEVEAGESSLEASSPYEREPYRPEPRLPAAIEP